MNTEEPNDLPMTPTDGSEVWFESGPEPVLDDPKLATLIVRMGMATNALNAQFSAARNAAAMPEGSAKNRDVISTLVTVAALTNEAIEFARHSMPTLRALVHRTPKV